MSTVDVTIFPIFIFMLLSEMLGGALINIINKSKNKSPSHLHWTISILDIILFYLI